MKKAKNLIEHFENHLGRIKRGWNREVEGFTAPFQVIQLANGCRPETIGFATLGLSEFRLRSAVSERFVRMEYLVSLYPEGGVNYAPGLLEQIGKEVIGSNKALVRGSFLAKEGRLLGQSKLAGLYCTLPFELPETFDGFRTELDSDGIQVAWLCPIMQEEVAFLREFGAEKFEERCAKAEVDFSDVFRPSIV